MQVKFYKHKDDVLYFLTFYNDKFVLEESKNWEWRKLGANYYIKRIEKYGNGKTKLDFYYRFGQNVFYEKSHAEVQLEVLGKELATSLSLTCPNCKTEYTWSGRINLKVTQPQYRPKKNHLSFVLLANTE